MPFQLQSSFTPAGDQPEAIRQLTEGLQSGEKFQTLLGVTGSGKTFTMANVIQQVQRPTLVMTHNKTLVAQLYGEFRQFFPNNAVEQEKYYLSNVLKKPQRVGICQFVQCVEQLNIYIAQLPCWYYLQNDRLQPCR